MTSISFTGNLSGVIPFSGVVKIKVDDMQRGEFVQILEERVDGTYENAVDKDGNLLQLRDKQRSALFELLGNYKIQRSSDSISVGYES